MHCMKTNNTPIIFIHFNNSGYLRCSLDLAKKKNPEKKVILLGDHTNKHYKKLDIEHYYFEDYDKGKEIEKFEKVYQFIAGAEKRKPYWTNFVFKRWFYIYNFIRKNDIQKFWTFDSDTLILTSLRKFEKNYADFDCTTQCNGSCMNGLINNQQVVSGYLDKINELFQKNNYLNEFKQNFKNHPDWAFTEMAAFATYEKEKNIKTARLNKIINNTTFDECICQDGEMEMESKKNISKKIHKLYFHDGQIFEKCLKNKKLIRVNTINMSWVPLTLIEKIYYYSLCGKFPPFYALLFNFLQIINRILRRRIWKQK